MGIGEDAKVGTAAATMQPWEKNLSLEPTCRSVSEKKETKNEREREKEYTSDIILPPDQVVPEA